MNMIIMLFFMICVILMAIILIILLVSKKSIIDNQKATPFECGFNPMSYSRLPFSIHFFMIAVIFLIFDIEIIMIMPMILTVKTSMVKYWLLTSIMFTVILIVGLIHEWKNGMISWTS
uniref:NADH-ubiquinone oxidoreductase chain 3 n=1 Tax=Kolla paulula TaxID=700811 RepID=A0A1Z2RRW8_9HEMI|nr:NADH dehydrogenase subunit 3 [Phlogotettix monozoneus]ASA46948.1 NADH dehydrogenase subunit 3 [Kolla paulula]QCB91445.1 NADH dehydrogenase subunit 3 [Phlogotettix monozoneus]